jgi:putative Mg2+ transporter-C (MgtC) family protein
VAAQIVSGIGFLGAGLPVIAALSTGVYLLVALAFPLLTRRLPRSATAISVIRVYYPDGRGILREVPQLATARGFAVDELSTVNPGSARPAGDGQSPARRPGSAGEAPMVEVTLQVHGRGQVNDLAAGLSEIPGVRAVVADDVHAAGE